MQSACAHGAVAAEGVVCGQYERAQTRLGQCATRTGERSGPSDVLTVGVDAVGLVVRVAEAGGIVCGIAARLLQYAATKADRAAAVDGASRSQGQVASVDGRAAQISIGARKGTGAAAGFDQTHRASQYRTGCARPHVKVGAAGQGAVGDGSPRLLHNGEGVAKAPQVQGAARHHQVAGAVQPVCGSQDQGAIAHGRDTGVDIGSRQGDRAHTRFIQTDATVQHRTGGTRSHVKRRGAGQSAIADRAARLLHTGQGVAIAAQVQSATRHRQGAGIFQSIGCAQGQGACADGGLARVGIQP